MITGARVLVAKVGLDAADRGASSIVRVLRDAGHEVVFSAAGLTPSMVAEACAAEQPDVLVATMPAQAMPLLTPALPPEQVLVRDGGHAWKVWSPALGEVLRRVDATRGGSAPEH